MTPRANERQQPDSEHLDEALRRSLDPASATAERLVRTALAETADTPFTVRPWRLVTASAAAILAVIAFSKLTPERSRNTSGIRETPPAPTLLVISNEDGPVTITTPAGSKLILLPGETS